MSEITKTLKEIFISTSVKRSLDDVAVASCDLRVARFHNVLQEKKFAKADCESQW